MLSWLDSNSLRCALSKGGKILICSLYCWNFLKPLWESSDIGVPEPDMILFQEMWWVKGKLWTFIVCIVILFTVYSYWIWANVRGNRGKKFKLYYWTSITFTDYTHIHHVVFKLNIPEENSLALDYKLVLIPFLHTPLSGHKKK